MMDVLTDEEVVTSTMARALSATSAPAEVWMKGRGHWQPLEVLQVKGEGVYFIRETDDQGRELIRGYNLAALEQAHREHRIWVNPTITELLARLEKIRQLVSHRSVEDAQYVYDDVQAETEP